MAFTVHAYRVEPNSQQSARLEDLLAQCGREPLEQRIRQLGTETVRLEEIEARDGLLYLDFVRLRREHGPGRAHPSEHVTGFRFKPGEGFGEETAALYDPRHRNLILQFNFAGVRSGYLSEYFSALSRGPDDLYELIPRLDPEVETKLRHKRIIKKLSFKLPVEAVRGVDRAAGVPLTRVLGISQEYGAETIKITLSAGRSPAQSLDREMFGRVLRWLGDRQEADENSVKAISVTGKESVDEQSEVLNLLGHRLRIAFDDLRTGEDLRYPLASRWEALTRAYNGWRRVLNAR